MQNTINGKILWAVMHFTFMLIQLCFTFEYDQKIWRPCRTYYKFRRPTI